MNHMSITRIAAMIAVLIGLAGCALNVPPATQLPSTAAASGPAVDIEANGTRHVVWQDCGTSCSIIYHRTTSAGVSTKIALAPPAGEAYREPDIAVTDDGRAFIVWRSLTAASNTYAPYFAVIPAGATTAPARQALAGASTAAIASDPPSVTARGNTVHAVYFAPSGTNVYLYKRRLNPLDIATQMTANPNTKISNASLAIDSLGNLHVAYEYGAADGSQYQALFYHGPSSMQKFIANNASPIDYYSNPDLELDSADNAYVLYKTEGVGLDILRVSPSGQETKFVVWRNDTTLWTINHPDMAVVGSNLEIAFSGSNSTQPPKTAVIWKMSLTPSSGAVTPPAQISPSSVWIPVAPRIANVQNYPVIMWTQVDPGTGHCTYEAFYWEKSNGVRKVFTSTGCHQDELDVAVEGEWVSGVSISGSQSNVDLPAPWIAYNTK
jgi:hypothetical protein